MDRWLGINDILGTELAAISCPRKFKVYYDTTRWKTLTWTRRSVISDRSAKWTTVQHGTHTTTPISHTLFFHNISKLDSCLHHLLQPLRDTSVTSRLRSSTPLPRPISRTKKFESFLNFALNNYQSPL